MQWPDFSDPFTLFVYGMIAAGFLCILGLEADRRLRQRKRAHLRLVVSKPSENGSRRR